MSGDDRVPSYDLSTSIGTPSAVQRRVVGSFSLSDWWARLQQSQYGNPVQKLFAGRANGLVLVAISNAYVPLLANELMALSETQRVRLRLFGAVDSRYPSELRPLLMPYDSRLDALISGSKVDFAQRAAEHFALGMMNELSFPQALDQQRLWVKASLDAVVVKPTEKRLATDDASILQFAREFVAQGLSRTKALAVLRRKHGVACEQSRFRRLFIEAARCATA